MIFHWPDGIGTPGKVSRQVGHLWDIFPTSLDLAGLDYPSEYEGRALHPLDGESLLPQIKSGTETDRTLCWDYEKFSAVRLGKWKALRQSKNKDQKDGDWQLYDLSKDRTEMNDVASAHPETVETLVKIWNDWQQDVGGLHKPKGDKEKKERKPRRQK
jgi:arylsulfatase